MKLRLGDAATLRLIDDLAKSEETRDMIARHYFRAKEARRLMREAGYGVTGMDILETTKQVLWDLKGGG